MVPIRSWVYGSNASCNFVIGAAEVFPQHCLLAEYSTGYALEDLGSPSGTWVNGVRLPPRQPQWVSAKDHIFLGGTIRLPWPDQPTPVAPSTQTPNRGTVPLMAAFRTGEQPVTSRNAPRTIRIGRAPENDVVIDYPVVSGTHARLTQEPGGRLILEDLGSTNGTAVGRLEQRIQRAEVRPNDNVFFGSFKIPVSKLLSLEKIELGAAAHHSVAVAGAQMILGRDPDCDYPIDSPLVSWHHAKLLRLPAGIEIEDLGSQNGTFVDGVQIDGRVALRVGSEVGLGSLRFRLLDATGRLEQRDYSGNVTIEAVGVVVEIRKGGVSRRLLDPVSVTIFPSELVALMGLAGAGKTTLMKALNGYTRPNAGHVLFNGEDLYANQDQFRLQVGYVPQDDILHTQLTVREALYYTAKLRTDLRPKEIEARITEILTDLGIEDIGNRLIGSPERKVISGGQRKRVNIAMELLSDPSVLFLDEPTSGLSSYDAYQVVRLLRKLANSGKTIVCTIHQPSLDIFKEFDSLMMVARDKGDKAGALAFFGPAYPSSIEFFSGQTERPGEPLSPEQLMSGVASRPATDWTATYQHSAFRQSFVDSRAGRVVATNQRASKSRWELGLGQIFTQTITLLRRNVLLKVRDRIQTAILLAQAPLFAVLLAIVFQGLSDQAFTDPAKWAQFSSKVGSTIFLVVVAGVWFGCNNAARDIVGETAIFQRERMVNLKLTAYILSKLGTLAFICLFQCLALLGIVYFACDLSGHFVTLLGILFVSSLVGASIGLLISALAPTTESAIAFLPVVLLPFILLAGGIKPLSEMPKPAQWIAAICPTRWAYEASFLEEAQQRKSTFKNALEEQLLSCRAAVGQCEARVAGRRPAVAPVKAAAIETDVAASAFPVSEGRSSLARSFEILGGTLATCLILLLSALGLKKQS